MSAARSGCGALTPRTDAVIEDCMRRFPGTSERASARYYEEVHQALAPLCRELESENGRLRAELAGEAP